MPSDLTLLRRAGQIVFPHLGEVEHKPFAHTLKIPGYKPLPPAGSGRQAEYDAPESLFLVIIRIPAGMPDVKVLVGPADTAQTDILFGLKKPPCPFGIACINRIMVHGQRPDPGAIEPVQAAIIRMPCRQGFQPCQTLARGLFKQGDEFDIHNPFLS